MCFVIILSNTWPLEKLYQTHYADMSPKRPLPFSWENIGRLYGACVCAALVNLGLLWAYSSFNKS